MNSTVSGFLTEALDPIIQTEMLEPGLNREFPMVLPLITRINKAHVVMLTKKKILTKEIARKLATAILELEALGPAAFTLDPAKEESYFNYEAELINRVGSDVGGRVHIARSRNDLYATMDRLRARDVTANLRARLLELREAVLSRARKHRNVVMPGYTHLQPAQPTTFGYYLAGIGQALERDYKRIAECWSRINISPLGAGAIVGTSFEIDRSMTSRLLGFEDVGPHAQDCIAARDYLVELLSDLTLATTTLSRMAQDFFVMTSYEFRTLELPDSVAQTSSMMPQKKNMSALEVLRASAAQVLGAHVSAVSGLRATHYSFGFDACCDPFRWTWEALEAAKRVMSVACVVINKAEPCPDRMLELTRTNFSTVTDLADLIVRESDLSFREAHHLVGGIVRAAMLRGLSADQIDSELIAEQSEVQIGRRIELPPTTVSESVDPIKSIQARHNSGGASEHDMAITLDGLEDDLIRSKEAHAQANDKLSRAEQTLEQEFRKLITS